MGHLKYRLLIMVTAILTIPSCDPGQYGYWYIENQLEEDIIVTRSDTTEIHYVYIPVGGSGLIYAEGGGLTTGIDDLIQSFCYIYKQDTLVHDTLVIMNGDLDTLYKLHPPHRNEKDGTELNKEFWDINFWDSAVEYRRTSTRTIFIYRLE
jgi:hypothetical protein